MEYPNDFELEMDAALLADPIRKIDQDYEAKLARGVSRDVAWQEKIGALEKLLGEGNEDNEVPSA